MKSHYDPAPSFRLVERVILVAGLIVYFGCYFGASEPPKISGPDTSPQFVDPDRESPVTNLVFNGNIP